MEVNCYLNKCVPSEVICSDYFMSLKIKPLPKKKKLFVCTLGKTELIKPALPSDTIITWGENLTSHFNIFQILKKTSLVTDGYWIIKQS